MFKNTLYFNKAYSKDCRITNFHKLTHQERDLEVQWFLKPQPKLDFV